MERLTVNDLNKTCYDPWELCGMDGSCTKGCHEEGGCAKGCNILKIYRKLAEYEDLEEQGLLKIFPCKVGDAVYVDSKTIPTINMDFEDVKETPLYFKAIVVSFRQNSNGKYIKLRVRAKWLHEWIDPECGPDSAYFETEKYFTYPLSAIGKTVFLMQVEAEETLKRMEGENEAD